MNKWWLVGAVAGLMLLGACQSGSDSARPVEDKPTVTVEEATMAVEEASERASESVRDAMEGVREAGDESITTITAGEFVDFAYEASDIAEFCEATDVLGEAVSYDLFLKGAGELIEDRRFEWPTPREVFDELMERC